MLVVLILMALPLNVYPDSPDPVEHKPRYIIYYNSNASPLAAAADTDFTHVIVSFVRIVQAESGELNLIMPKHMTGQWESIAKLKAAGKTVMISYGGGQATSAEYNPLVNREAEVAALLVQFVKKYDLDGLDIDFEASDMLHQKPKNGLGNARGFLTRLTRALRKELPGPRYLISHAPEPPYLSPGWHGGPYLEILEKVGDDIDWINVTYYNNRGFNHPIPDSSDKRNHTGTAYSDLIDKAGNLAWPAHKIVVGKPVYTADAVSGFVVPSELVATVIKPLYAQYGEQFGGLAGWQFSVLTEDHQAWNHEVGQSFLK